MSSKNIFIRGFDIIPEISFILREFRKYFRYEFEIEIQESL